VNRRTITSKCKINLNLNMNRLSFFGITLSLNFNLKGGREPFRQKFIPG
jgi:hypothetical protein